MADVKGIQKNSILLMSRGHKIKMDLVAKVPCKKSSRTSFSGANPLSHEYTAHKNREDARKFILGMIAARKHIRMGQQTG